MKQKHCCPWWAGYFLVNPLRRLFQKPEVILGSFVRKGMIVLDLGCGMGFYSIAMARMVGSEGKVISVDIQQKMLDNLRRRAQRANVLDRITTHLAQANEIGIKEKVDFALAMWMVHEVGETEKFLAQVKACLKENGRFLIVEPKMHVGRKSYQKTIKLAEECWLKMVERPKVGLNHAAVLALI